MWSSSPCRCRRPVVLRVVGLGATLAPRAVCWQALQGKHAKGECDSWVSGCSHRSIDPATGRVVAPAARVFHVLGSFDISSALMSQAA